MSNPGSKQTVDKAAPTHSDASAGPGGWGSQLSPHNFAQSLIDQVTGIRYDCARLAGKWKAPIGGLDTSLASIITALAHWRDRQHQKWQEENHHAYSCNVSVEEEEKVEK